MLSCSARNSEMPSLLRISPLSDTIMDSMLLSSGT